MLTNGSTWLPGWIVYTLRSLGYLGAVCLLFGSMAALAQPVTVPSSAPHAEQSAPGIAPPPVAATPVATTPIATTPVATTPVAQAKVPPAPQRPWINFRGGPGIAGGLVCCSPGNLFPWAGFEGRAGVQIYSVGFFLQTRLGWLTTAASLNLDYTASWGGRIGLGFGGMYSIRDLSIYGSGPSLFGVGPTARLAYNFTRPLANWHTIRSGVEIYTECLLLLGRARDSLTAVPTFAFGIGHEWW